MNERINESLSESLDAELNKEFPGTRAPLTVKMPQAMPKMRTLTEQWQQLTRIETELRERIRKERIDIMADNDKRWIQMKNDHAKDLSDAKARIDKEYEDKLLALQAETTAKLHENEILGKHVG
jgi:hypothetical protein